MANRKYSDDSALATWADEDTASILDKSDTTDGAGGTSKQTTYTQIKAMLAALGSTPAFNGVNLSGGFLNVGAGSELTIASGVITVTQSFHTVDTEADAASDPLTDIQGGSNGDVLFLSANNNARTVVVTDGTGSIRSAGDFDLDTLFDVIIFIKIGGFWLEVSRSDNQ